MMVGEGVFKYMCFFGGSDGLGTWVGGRCSKFFLPCPCLGFLDILWNYTILYIHEMPVSRTLCHHKALCQHVYFKF